MHPASGLSIEDRDRVADALEAPWGIRQERRLRGVFAPDRVAPGELTRRIADVVNELRLQPCKPPEPLDPIEEEEVNLVVLDGGSESGPLTEMQRSSHLGVAQLSRLLPLPATFRDPRDSMPRVASLPIKQLQLDLRNFRTVPQANEEEAVDAMVSIRPGWFWALMESLLDSEYLPIENILVLEGVGSDGKPTFTVKEGNRRVAALKIAHGLLNRSHLEVPANIESELAVVSSGWRAETDEVPCIIYPASESDTVDRIVTLAHGKGQKAGRSNWTAVARARHSRDESGANEPALDLLEAYLADGKNRTPHQAQQWAGDYPLTVLAEAMKRLAGRLGADSARDLANRYPSISHRDAVEAIALDIGLKLLTFTDIRKPGEDFAERYGIPPLSGDDDDDKPGSGEPKKKPGKKGGTGKTGTKTGAKTKGGKAPAASLRDPRAVKATVTSFTPRGPDREKVVLLRDEIRALNLRNNPLAFCFLVRSMFEISAKAYCGQHGAKGGLSTRKKGRDRTLVDILRDITKHLTKNKADKERTKQLHGAMTELARPEGLLSVTSMNQLVHNPKFSVTTGDVCQLFGNIFPLLEAMNE